MPSGILVADILARDYSLATTARVFPEANGGRKLIFIIYRWHNVHGSGG